jgi:hypothetical protein
LNGDFTKIAEILLASYGRIHAEIENWPDGEIL